jgi:hypothetical protein
MPRRFLDSVRHCGRLASAAKAAVDFPALFGTVETVPFQNIREGDSFTQPVVPFQKFLFFGRSEDV